MISNNHAFQLNIILIPWDEHWVKGEAKLSGCSKDLHISSYFHHGNSLEAAYLLKINVQEFFFISGWIGSNCAESGKMKLVENVTSQIKVDRKLSARRLKWFAFYCVMFGCLDAFYIFMSSIDDWRNVVVTSVDFFQAPLLVR